jgi:quercetin dioxygenase-like cupin family protein
MKVQADLQHRLPESGEPQRIVLFDRETGAHNLSAVLVRLPGTREFSLHTHPTSEDCFFVLSGAGEAIEPGRRFPISAPAGVWIPPGHPHGLCAGSGGMLEVGFQSPADHMAIPFAGEQNADVKPSLVVSAAPPVVSPGQWSAAFPGRSSWRYLDAQYVALEPSQNLTIDSRDLEWAVVVASGEVELCGPPDRSLSAISVIRLDPGASLTVRATASTLLIGVNARTAT